MHFVTSLGKAFPCFNTTMHLCTKPGPKSGCPSLLWKNLIGLHRDHHQSQYKKKLCCSSCNAIKTSEVVITNTESVKLDLQLFTHILTHFDILARKHHKTDVDYLKHGRQILKQHGDVFVVSIGPILWLGVFTERPYMCPGLILGPAEKVCQLGLHIATVGFKQGCYERIQHRKECNHWKIVKKQFNWSAQRNAIHTPGPQQYASSQRHAILFYSLLCIKINHSCSHLHAFVVVNKVCLWLSDAIYYPSWAMSSCQL